MAERTYFPQRLNLHHPSMQYAADLGFNGIGQFSIGAPATLSATGILNATAITNAALTITTGMPTSFGNVIAGAAAYGRALSVKGGTAGDNAVISLIGRDYLNQPMTEKIALSGTAGVNGKKAFFYLDSVVVAAGNANASSTLSVGTLDVFGVPYRMVALTHSLINEVTATAFTFAAPPVNATADVSTAGTADPRGTVAPGTAANGTNVYAFAGLFDRTNLHGNVRAAT
jgi:hypothetical protein